LTCTFTCASPGFTIKENHRHGHCCRARRESPLVCMPNTSTAWTNPRHSWRAHPRRRGSKPRSNVYRARAISKGLAGEELASIGSLKRAALVAITDDGPLRPENNELMRGRWNTRRCSTLPTSGSHAKDYALVTDGVAHEGYWSMALGSCAVDRAGRGRRDGVARTSCSPRTTRARALPAYSVRAAVWSYIREAKARGLPHHRARTTSFCADVCGRWPGSESSGEKDGKGHLRFRRAQELPSGRPTTRTFKMNHRCAPRGTAEAILAGLADGTIDVLCSDLTHRYRLTR